MDIETKKIKSPYKPATDYFSDLALKIQQKVGIDPIELGVKQETVTFKPMASEPIQLTVEFGFPLTTQRSSEPDISMPAAPLPAVENLPSVDNLPTELAPIAPVQECTTEDPIPTTELEFSDEDLDRLHAEMTGESFMPSISSSPNIEEVQNNTPVSKLVEIDAKKDSVSFWAMIPWSSLLGVAASLFAVAAAWFIWNQIQKPLTVEQRVAKAVNFAPKIAAAAVTSSPEKKELNIEALPVSHQVIYEMIQEGNIADQHKMNFNQMPEQSKISSVELERNGLTVLDLEDQIFDEIEL